MVVRPSLLRRWRVLNPITLLAGLLCLATMFAQEFRIEQTRVVDGFAELTVTPSAEWYYILRRGDSPAVIEEPADMILGERGSGLLHDSVPFPQVRFYQVQRVPVDAPLQTDGDGIDDVWELRFRHPGSALNGADALEDHNTNGIPDLHEVLDPVASFSTASSTVLANAESALIRVVFNKTYNGPVRVLLSGTASPGRDYNVIGLNSNTLIAEVQSSGTEVSIPITLRDAPTIERDRTLVLALLEPQAPNAYRLASNSNGPVTHSLLIREATQGVFAGTMTFTNGVALPTQSLKLALRADLGSEGEAYVDAIASTFFRTNFTLAVHVDPASRLLTFPQPVSRVIETNSLGRPLTWRLSISAAVVTNDVLTAPVRLTVQGLTATSYELEALGTLLLTRLNAGE